MIIYTKEDLIIKLKEIRDLGWIENTRPGNAGAVGNILEDLLGIKENNLPIPNAAEWELKCQRKNTSSLTTLLHIEPSPRAVKFVPQIFLFNYGWKHSEAGKKYPENEMSFRQTIHGQSRSDRGFKVVIDREQQKVLISFDANSVDVRHSKWLKTVDRRIGLKELNPQPYWGFDDLFHKAATKLLNCFYVIADTKQINGIEYFHYESVLMLSKFSLENLLKALENGYILIDFDARTGHNHGTKFRLRQNRKPELYDSITKIF